MPEPQVTTTTPAPRANLTPDVLLAVVQAAYLLQLRSR